MYIHDNIEKNIIYNKYLIFKKQLLLFFIGKLNENEFKVFRLQVGIYRQKLSYMYRLLIPYSFFSLKQIYLISYIIHKFDKNYLHFTTRTNVQFNWFKIINSFDIIFYLLFCNLISIQTSGNCVRNITINYNFYIKNYINNKPWAELIKQWFMINSEFLFFPRKFKISILSFKKDYNFVKIHDLSFFIKKTSINSLLIDILLGGGLGRIPLKGFYIIKNIHWKNIINCCDKILKIYNINGYRDNLYKSRIKILLKNISLNKFIYFLKNNIIYFNNFLYIINEREINRIIFYFYNKIFNCNLIDNYYFEKKIKFNIFFSNWFFLNTIIFKYNKVNVFLLLKYLNSPPGDINYIQLKILFYINLKFNFKLLFINNKQNIIFNICFFYLYDLYIYIKKYFFFIYNNNSIFNIVCCPGKNFCSLANSESILLTNSIQKFFLDYNSLIKLNYFTFNISGCINSCAHHHLSNIGFLGVKKNNNSYYQFCLGGDNTFNNLLFSNVLGSSINFDNSLFFFIKFLKFFLKIKKNFKYFLYIYNMFGFNFFKNFYNKNEC